MAERLLTPTKITAWLDCPHYLTLKHAEEAGGGGGPRSAKPFGSFAQLLLEKGLEHEQACLDEYRHEGRRILEVPDRQAGETFAEWVQRVSDALHADVDVLYQMPFIHDGVRGIADFLERVDDERTGAPRWRPVDAKLARNAAKPGHVLQLCFYAEALTADDGAAPHDLDVWLGSSRRVRVVHEDVRPYWARLRTQLARVLDGGDEPTDTRPEPCDHCGFCEFESRCEQEWRDADSLVFVAGLRGRDRAVLEAEGVTTLATLAAAEPPVEGLPDERLARLRAQAGLQLEARTMPEARPPFRLIEPGDDPTWGHGFEQLPAPDPGDVFLDFEGHPFWRADRGLFFLFGYVARDDEDGAWRYHAIWAHDEAGERDGVEALVRTFDERRARHPGMHVYHYNHTERSALEALAAEHGVAESALARQVESGLYVDLLVVARNAIQVGTESYGLKHLERLTDYERGHDIDKGAGAVIEYERFTEDGDHAHLTAIAAYNEDDVRATLALRDWLVDHRPAEVPWRAAVIELDDAHEDIDAKLEALHAFEPGTHQHLLGDLLGYWLREWRAYLAPRLGTLTHELGDLVENPEVLAGLRDGEIVERVGKRGTPLADPAMRLRFPPQPLCDELVDKGARKVIYTTADGLVGYSTIHAIDVDEGWVDLVWKERCREIGTVPDAVVLDDWYSPKPKPATLGVLVDQVLDPDTHGQPNDVTMALLRRDLPRFVADGAPDGGRFTDDLDAMCRWACSLDGSVLAVQGPPGTGKTYRGARMVQALLRAGRRVGITAMSHHAIDNLLGEISDVCTAEGSDLELRAIRRGKEPASGPLPGVTYTDKNTMLAKPEFNLVAGTSWQFAGGDLRGSPVDVLFIDEAGQLSLVDAVVSSMSARNVVLLGDPLQLAQVTTAVHPGGSGASVLGHLLGEAATMPPERGVFIEETWRMHPDVCRFISDRIYEGRLTSHPSCAVQGTAVGTGLRWVPAEHEGCSTESAEEGELVADHIEALLGQSWTDSSGRRKVLGVDDFMVVAPYNDQVHLLRDRLDRSATTRGVPVGTVDKFQGQQAPVVLFSMTSSSADDMPRGAEFLFSKNRLNVAISRARCLAYLVCTEALLDSRAKTIEDMQLIATLCAFAEQADRVGA